MLYRLHAVSLLAALGAAACLPEGRIEGALPGSPESVPDQTDERDTPPDELDGGDAPVEDGDPTPAVTPTPPPPPPSIQPATIAELTEAYELDFLATFLRSVPLADGQMGPTLYDVLVTIWPSYEGERTDNTTRMQTLIASSYPEVPIPGGEITQRGTDYVLRVAQALWVSHYRKVTWQLSAHTRAQLLLEFAISSSYYDSLRQCGACGTVYRYPDAASFAAGVLFVPYHDGTNGLMAGSNGYVGNGEIIADPKRYRVHYEDFLETSPSDLYRLAKNRGLIGADIESTVTNVLRYFKARFFHAYVGYGWDRYADGRPPGVTGLHTPASLSRYFDERISGCHEPTIFLQRLLGALAIPSIMIFSSYDGAGHGIVYLPTLDRFVHGDTLVDYAGVPARAHLLTAADLHQINLATDHRLGLLRRMAADGVPDLEADWVSRVHLQRADDTLWVDFSAITFNPTYFLVTPVLQRLRAELPELDIVVVPDIRPQYPDSQTYASTPFPIAPLAEEMAP